MSRVLSVSVLLALATVALGCRDEAPGAALGTLERDRVELAADAAELLLEVLVREGDEVEAGAVVARLDDSRARVELERRMAERDRLGARVVELQRGGRPERRAEVEAEIASARAALALAQGTLERARRLEAEGIVASADVDVARAAVEEARGRVDRGGARLAELEAGGTGDELAQARFALAAADANVELAEQDRRRLELRAPGPGRVDAVLAEPGEQMVPGRVIVALLAHGAPWARVHVPAQLRAKVRSGVVAAVEVDGIEGALVGCVRWISSEASFTPYYALSQRDRGRLAWLAEIDVTDPRARELSAGLPVVVSFGKAERPCTP